MDLYLVRHGKAEAGSDDMRRALTEGGREAVQRVARRLERLDVEVERVEHSGLLRAEQTGRILADALHAPLVRAPGMWPENPVEPVAERLKGRSLLLVGHNPFMERLAAYLLCGDPYRPLLHFRTAAVAHLTGVGDRWTLEWLLSPQLLRPFNGDM